MYRFYLKDVQGNYYVQAPDGNVGYTATPTPIKYAPKNWESMTIEWNRNVKYKGIFRSIATPLEFVEDGRAILRFIYYTQGIEGVCNIEIKRQNDQTLVWEQFYTGRIDFQTLLDYEFFIKVNIIEGGLKGLVDTLNDTVFEILIDENDVAIKHVYIDGVQSVDNARYLPVTDNVTITANGYLIANTYFVDRDGDLYVGLFQGQPHGVLRFSTGNFQDEFMKHYFFKAQIPQKITFYLKQKIGFRFEFVTPPSVVPTLEVAILVVAPTKVIRRKIVLATYTGSLSYQNVTVDVTSAPFDVYQGEQLYLVYGFTGIGTDKLFLDIIGNEIDAEGNTIVESHHNFHTEFRIPGSTVAGYNYDTFLKKLVSAMSAGAYSAYSSFLNNPVSLTLDTYPYYEIVTSGDALRGIASPKIKPTLEQAFTDLSSGLGLAMGIEGNNIVFEPMYYFFDQSQIIADLGVVSNLTVEPALEYIYNTLRIGYTDQTYDKSLGKSEYFTTIQWSLPITVLKKEMTAVSPFRADVVGIELMRMGYYNKDDTDSSSDNDTFIIDVDPVKTGGPGLTPLVYRPPGMVLNGVPFGSTWYNVGRSPKRMLLRNSAFIRSGLEFLDSKYVVFQTTPKNPDVVFVGQSYTIAETEDELIGDLDNPIFKPLIFKGSCIPPVHLAALMSNNPRGCFQFEWNGKIYRGFPMSIGVNLSNYGSYDFVLLCTPDTDISNLVYGS